MNESDEDGVVVVSVVCQADLLCDRKRRWGRETGEEREKRRVSFEKFDSTSKEGTKTKKRKGQGYRSTYESLESRNRSLPRMMSEHRRKVGRVAMPEG